MLVALLWLSLTLRVYHGRPLFRVVLINFDPATGEQVIIERAVTAAEFNNGEVTFMLAETGVLNSISAYAYDSVASKITNIAYFVA